MTVLALAGALVACALAGVALALRREAHATSLQVGDAWLFVLASLVAPGLWHTFAKSPRVLARFAAFALAASMSGAMAGGLTMGSALLFASHGAAHVSAQALQLGLAAAVHAGWCLRLWFAGKHVLVGPPRDSLPGAEAGWVAALATILALL